MKRLSTLIVLLGLVLSAVVTGCNKSDDAGGTTSTNAAPVVPSTNK